ncbi:MAG TPA: glycoside hydrolase family 38 C-terminal domain-containing protein, partial [Spirochaetia bacterium]|nr:glycoside hydrolase family 38 C-terminal domain-containing protein [Spirochaetia bacterium]
AVELAEADLTRFAPLCKAYELMCAGHAHIDMNWMWGFQETVMITIDSFRTVLDLFARYPQFHFSQSQASVYHIIEKYAPELVPQIKARISEGRWEVTATQWVESDMNMPSGEGLVRQLLYAKRYLTERYDAPEDAFKLVFLPDTFGHNANTPEILGAAGVRYMYHCRGSADSHLYRWFAPSGRSIITYREPRWYNTDITTEIVRFLPDYFKETGLKTALCMFGVGDHGGGPTMRDIERLTDMGKWPLFPAITFSGVRAFFERIAAAAPVLPEIRTERNSIFTGCYTSQARIKMANRRAQQLLGEAELFQAFATGHDGETAPGVQQNLQEGWVNTLFAHFHDILPGSGIQLTREHALGRFQDTAASSISAISSALARLVQPGSKAAGGASSTHHPARSPEALWYDADTSHGAGVGFGAERFRLPLVGRGDGDRRTYRLFNSLQWDREMVAELVVWDWNGRPEELVCTTSAGAPVPSQVIEVGKDQYWGHRFVRLAVRVKAPGFGSVTVVVDRQSQAQRAAVPDNTFHPIGVANQLVEGWPDPVLENDRVRIEFDMLTMMIKSFRLKGRDTEVVPEGAHAGVFRLIDEDERGMTAWIVGRYHGVTELVRDVRITGYHIGDGALKQWIDYELPIVRDGQLDTAQSGGTSSLKVRVLLLQGTTRLAYEVTCDWLEAGVKGATIPQLAFAMPVDSANGVLRCDIPFGTIDRAPRDQDAPGVTFGAFVPADAGSPVIQISTDSKQGFRLSSDGLSVTLLRSSIDPDPYPELGRHQFSFAVSALDGAAKDPARSVREAMEVNYHLHQRSAQDAQSAENGSTSYLRVEAADGVIVAAVKQPEPETWAGQPAGGSDNLIVRVHEVAGRTGEFSLSRPGSKVTRATLLDLHEKPISGQTAISVKDGIARASVASRGVTTLLLEFGK